MAQLLGSRELNYPPCFSSEGAEKPALLKVESVYLRTAAQDEKTQMSDNAHLLILTALLPDHTYISQPEGKIWAATSFSHKSF